MEVVLNVTVTEMGYHGDAERCIILSVHWNGMVFHIHGNLHIHCPSDQTVSDKLDHLGEEIMAKFDEVNTALDGIAEESAAETLQVAEHLAALNTNVTALNSQIEDLKAQIAAGSAATPEQMDQLLQKALAIRAGVKAIDPSEVAPAPNQP